MAPPRLRNAVRGVAIFEALKGLAAFLGLLGLLQLLKHDLHHLALEWIGHTGLAPQQHYPALLLQAVDHINATPIHTLVWLGGLYITARWVEAWGLWHDRAWGEWLGVLSCGIYVPLEVRHLWHSPHWQGAAVLVTNLALMAVLALRLRERRRVPALVKANETLHGGHPVSQTSRADLPTRSTGR